MRGVHIRLRASSNYKGFDWAPIVSIFNPLEKPDGVTPRYMGGQHFWELGVRGFRRRDLKRRMSQFFEILSVYTNRDWLGSFNFILKSKLLRPPRGVDAEEHPLRGL
jgi:hypothetical protein